MFRLASKTNLIYDEKARPWPVSILAASGVIIRSNIQLLAWVHLFLESGIWVDGQEQIVEQLFDLHVTL